MNAHHSPLSEWADKSPLRWVLVWLVLVGSLLLSFTGEDASAEQAIADDLSAAQKSALRRARVHQILVEQCLRDRGPGAAPVYDRDGSFRCYQRRKA